MTDRELLELAAKAEGRTWMSYSTGSGKGLCCKAPGMSVEYYWNPLEDDGDALRLAVKLHLRVDTFDVDSSPPYSLAWKCLHDESQEFHGDDPYAATRRAIVRAAAEIGKEM